MSGGRPIPAGPAVREAVEVLGDAFHLLGLQRMEGRVWGLLFLTGATADAPWIVAALEASTGAVSTALRSLVAMGAVHKVAVAHSRRMHYRAEDNTWILTQRLFHRRIKANLVRLEKGLRRAAQGVDGAGDPGVAPLVERLEHLIEIALFAQGFFDAVTQRSKVEMKAVRTWLHMAERIGGRPLGRLRRALFDGVADTGDESS